MVHRGSAVSPIVNGCDSGHDRPERSAPTRHAARVVPIAPELRPVLQDLFDRAEVGAESVAPRLRDAFDRARSRFGGGKW